MYNRALYTYINICTYIHRHWQLLEPRSSRSFYRHVYTLVTDRTKDLTNNKPTASCTPCYRHSYYKQLWLFLINLIPWRLQLPRRSGVSNCLERKKNPLQAAPNYTLARHSKSDSWNQENNKLRRFISTRDSLRISKRTLPECTCCTCVHLLLLNSLKTAPRCRNM